MNVEIEKIKIENKKINKKLKISSKISFKSRIKKDDYLNPLQKDSILIPYIMIEADERP